MDPAIQRTASLFPGRIAAAPGHIYVWGKVGGKVGAALPVPETAVDAEGDCVFPARCIMPKGTGAIFVKTSVDVGPFCALDCMGRVWAWDGWKSDKWPAKPTPLLDHCVDCAAGSGFVVAVESDGSVWMLGKAPSPTSLPDSRSGWTALANAEAAIIAVDACEGVILAANAEGQLFSCGGGPALGLDPKAFPTGAASLTAVPGVPPVCSFSVGSLHAACIGRDDGSVWCWGDGLSGNLGTGLRQHAVTPTLVPPVQHGGASERAIHVSCTRGQARPKRNGSQRSFASGQEGPRTHLVTIDGALWIAGACHKGLGGDHIGKTLGTTGSDHLTFYRVGGRAQRVDTQEAVLTGAAEDWPRDPLLASRRMGMADPAAFGADGATGYLSGVRIISSCPSHIHSLALSEDGDAFAWGCGSDGRTGLAALLRGPGGTKRRLKCYVSAPSTIEALETSHRVLHLTSGRYWSLAVVITKQPQASVGAAVAAKVDAQRGENVPSTE